MHNTPQQILIPVGREAHLAHSQGATLWSDQPPRGNFNVTPVDLTVLMWNVRGINSEKKQRYLDWLITG